MKALFFALGLLVSLYTDSAQACLLNERYGAGLAQEWPEKDRAVWYETSQGSRLIPTQWYDALRRSDTGKSFKDAETLAEYTDLICTDTVLPLGFIKDTAANGDEAYGFTCAACHTGTLHDSTGRFLVEGGTSSMDLQSFMYDMYQSVIAVYRAGPPEQKQPWTDFANQVLGEGHTGSAASELRQQMAEWLDKRTRIQKSVDAGGTWGHGRTDAVAVILNTATTLSDPRAGAILPPADAPVSTPHVWNAPQMSTVQWTGSATKLGDIGIAKPIELGAVTRNIGEIIGVYSDISIGDADINDLRAYPNVKSSIRLGNLIKIERSLASLKSPAWPDEWGKIDPSSPSYVLGKQLYGDNCASCHSDLDRNDLTVEILDNRPGKTRVRAPFTQMVPIFDWNDANGTGLGTDPMAACNLLTHTSWSGRFSAMHNTFDSVTSLIENGPSADLVPEKFDQGVPTIRLIEELALRLLIEKRGEVIALQKQDIKEEVIAFAADLSEGVFGKDPGRTVDPQSTPDVPVKGTHGSATLQEARQICKDVLENSALGGRLAIGPVYKARPLNGIFATAPFLHNGSVPTIADLLLPPDQRPTEFALSNTYYDPIRMGLGDPMSDTSTVFRTRTPDGTIIPGNSNLGHAYPASATCKAEPSSEACQVDRAAILAYLKSL